MITLEQWLNNDQLAIDIWNRKYKHNDETFEQWLDRVSGGNEDVKKLILEKKFLFGGRTLANRGLHKEGKKVTYSNCYVLDSPEDSIEGIFKTASEMARTFSYGGGVGLALETLRPKGSKVNNSAEETTGSVSFMDLYSKVTDIIGQKGRRGALMLCMNVKHPDIEEFIDIKTDLDQVTKANISIKITDDFMMAVQEETMYNCEFVIDSTGEKITKEVDARQLFNKLAENNWNFAEPGILYWDRIEEWTPVSCYEEFKYVAPNPCGEQPLPAYGSCNLGSINLSEFVVNPFTKDAYFDFDSFIETCKIATIGMDEVLDEGKNLHPLEQQRQVVEDWNNIGIGVMGIADMFIKLGIRYGSDESLDICNHIGLKMFNAIVQESTLIAKGKGSFRKFDLNKTLKSEFIMHNCSKDTLDMIKNYGLRHAFYMSIAPTGTLSTMLGISGGIEPIFNLSYTRKTQSLHDGDVFYKVYTPIVKQYMEANNIQNEEDLSDIFVTAMNLNPMERVDLQAVWQEYIDSAISSTVNLPNSATVEDVKRIYTYAWEKGLKGITVYRSGCKREGILINDTDKKEESPTNELKRGDWKQIADDTVYYKRKLKSGCGSLNIFLGFSPSEQSIQEIYMKRSGNGGCSKNIETTVIAMSGMLRLGGNLSNIQKAFDGIETCPSYITARKNGKNVSKGISCGSSILHEINAFMQEIQGIPQTVKVETLKAEKKKETKMFDITNQFVKNENSCPECGEQMSSTGGCSSCSMCGYSHCS